MAAAAPALGLLGEEDDERGRGEDGRQPEESGIGAMLVHDRRTYKGRASNPCAALGFTSHSADSLSPSP